MNAEMYSLNHWVNADNYTICVHALKDMIVYDSGATTPAHVRSVRILVEYANHSNVSLKFRLSQWLLFDTEGFAYEFEIRNQFYEKDAVHKLKEGVMIPGQQVKGWVAFQLPKEAQLSHVQFQSQEVHPEPQNGPKSGTMKCYRIDGTWLYCRLFTRRNSRWRNASPQSRLTELCSKNGWS